MVPTRNEIIEIIMKMKGFWWKYIITIVTIRQIDLLAKYLWKKQKNELWSYGNRRILHFLCSYFASDPKLKIKVLICVLKNTYFLKNVIINFFWKFVVEKNKALSIRKVQLLYFNGEKTNFKAKILVSRSKIYEFSEEKFLIFPM